MAKNSDARKLLPGFMDPCAILKPNARMGRPRPKSFRKTFIRAWRKHRGLTLEQLGERIDMTAGNLSHLETGRQGYTQDTLESIAEALQTDVASLLMRDPTADEAMWSVWDQAKPGQRRQIVEISKTIVRTGTDD